MANLINVKTLSSQMKNSSVTEVMIAAIEMILNNGGGIIYLPSGDYSFSQRIDISLDLGVSLKICGDGQGLSNIFWEEGGGFRINLKPQGCFDGRKGSIIVENLSLITNEGLQTTALEIISYGKFTSPTPYKIFRNLTLAGSTSESGWEYGIKAVDCAFVKIDGLDYQGIGTAVLFDGENHPTDFYINNLRVFGGDNGLEVKGNCEGIYVTNSTILFVKNGIFWQTEGKEPFLSVSGTHISASHSCIFAKNLMQPIIRGNLLYQDGDNEWTGIYIFSDNAAETDLLQISMNTIHGFSSSNKPSNGVVVSNTSGGIIQGNLIHNIDSGIWLQDGSEDLRILDNFIKNFKVIDIKDEGINNIIRKK